VERIRVAVRAPDLIDRAGVIGLLTAEPGVTVVEDDDAAGAQLVVAVYDRLTASAISAIRRSEAEHPGPVVLVSDEVDDQGVLLAVEGRVVAILPRDELTAERLTYSVRTAARGGVVLSPAVAGRLLDHIHRLNREVSLVHGVNAAGLTARDVAVLRLVADGLVVVEIADRLGLSVLAVKRTLMSVNRRLHLRNRTQAMAYAMRAGLF
jgi:DNA-binding NarL/FixJ family response regulator